MQKGEAGTQHPLVQWCRYIVAATYGRSVSVSRRNNLVNWLHPTKNATVQLGVGLMTCPPAHQFVLLACCSTGVMTDTSPFSTDNGLVSRP